MSKITNSARGEECTLQIHPYCNGNPESVVLCHLTSPSKGIALKSPDHWAVYGCMACHDVIDSRNPQAVRELGWREIEKCIYRALFRTWDRLMAKGLIEVKN